MGLNTKDIFTTMHYENRQVTFEGWFLCKELRDLYDYGKVGEQFSTQGIYGDRYTIYVFVKVSANKITCRPIHIAYSEDRSAQRPEVCLEITGRKIKYFIHDHRWHTTGHTLKSLLRNDTFNIDLVNVNWVRSAYIVSTASGKQAIGRLSPLDRKKMSKEALSRFKRDMKVEFDWKGNLLNQSTENRKYTEAILDADRKQNNANARSRYQHNKSTKKWTEAQKTGDYSKIEITDIFKVRNVTHKTEMLEHFGPHEVIDSLEHKVLDKDNIGGRAYRLLAVKVPTIAADTTYDYCNYLEMINPSTGEVHIEGIPNSPMEGRWNNPNTTLQEESVKCALAWRDGDDWSKEKYNTPIVLT